MYDHSTLAHAPDSHFREYKYSDVDTGGLKQENRIVVEDKNEIMFDLRIKDFEGEKGSLPTEERDGDGDGDGITKLPRLHDLVDMEDSLNVRENETIDSSTSGIPLDEVKLSDKETEFYTDKSVTECELPDIICLKEGAHHVVKDIWIDEGLPSLDKILIQNGELHHNGFVCDTEVDSELTKEIVQTAVPISDGTNPFIESECEIDGVNKCESDHLLEKSEGYIDAREEILAMIFNEKINLEDKLLVEECTNSSHNEPCNIDGDEANQDICDEAKSVNLVASSAAEVSNCNQGIELPLKSEVEGGSSTEHNIDSLPPTTSGREEPPSTDCKSSVQTFNKLCHEEDTLDSQAASTRSFFIQHGHGETSFSSVGPMSGPISYSGPVPYSGSISLRSDSSTTSTRSFAFPVMHTEWNSSPVKMAKADRRNFRKHRSWRTSLLCCKF